ncbi:MAG: ABC transporter permease [Taibaiella sp.]|nr:ABC transporter permease [Taibaiella sp.]
MNSIVQIIGTSIVQALQELRVNKLRTLLSLLGITIGIFCIIAVLTALDSARGAIQKNVETLGSDVLYVGRWPWPGMEDGEYKWWEYWRRPSLTNVEANAINAQLHDMALTTLCLPVGNLTVKHSNNELSNIRAYTVNSGFDKIQNIDIAQGRYLSAAEIGGGNNTIVLGSDVCNNLFPTGISPLGKSISLLSRKFIVVGVMKKVGQSMADFDFDNGVIFPYTAVIPLVDVKSLEYNPRLIVKAYNPNNVGEVKDEIRGIIRRIHKLRPAQADDFVVNQLSGISKIVDDMFGTIDIVGLFIGGFSLLVGTFGIANIMFVTVKERTKFIGLKKAIGARRISIMLEFLVEAIVLCVIGGLVGIFIVLVLSFAVSHALDMEVVLSLKNFLVGIIVSIFVGILSGFIPARSASKLDPVVAIRTN